MSLPRPYYEENGFVIYLGDCRDILPHLRKVDLILTDPPYGVGENYLTYDDSIDNLQSLIKDTMPLILRVAHRAIITPGVRNVWRYPAYDWMLAWVVQGGTKAVPWGFACWTPFLCYGKSGPRGNGQTDGKSDVLIMNNCAADELRHPCAKPLAVWKWALDKGSAIGETVIDPFMGSGTTLRAAKDLGRKCIGIEIEERYCEIAVRRLAQEVLKL